MQPTKEDLRKVLTGAAIAGAGAALYYAIDWASGFDFGDWGPVVSGLLAVAVNALRKARNHFEQ